MLEQLQVFAIAEGSYIHTYRRTSTWGYESGVIRGYDQHASLLVPQVIIVGWTFYIIRWRWRHPTSEAAKAYCMAALTFSLGLAGLNYFLTARIYKGYWSDIPAAGALVYTFSVLLMLAFVVLVVLMTRIKRTLFERGSLWGSIDAGTATHGDSELAKTGVKDVSSTGYRPAGDSEVAVEIDARDAVIHSQVLPAGPSGVKEQSTEAPQTHQVYPPMRQA